MKVQFDDIVAMIKDANTMINIESLTEEVNLRDVGADSLDMMNIFLAIQEKFGVEIPDDDIAELTDIKAITNYINSNIE